MPPKPKFSREEIIDCAYQLTRQSGIDAVAARTVGKQLGTSSTPIFTFFENMDELKQEVLLKARSEFVANMEGIFAYTPAFKEMGMRWIRFAVEEPQLYRILFPQTDTGDPSDAFKEAFGEMFGKIIKEIEASFGLSYEDADNLVDHMLIYANGLASMMLSGLVRYSEEEISCHIGEICLGLVVISKIRSGNYDPNVIKAMAAGSKDVRIPSKKMDSGE